MRYGSESDAVSPGPRRPSFALNSLGKISLSYTLQVDKIPVFIRTQMAVE